MANTVRIKRRASTGAAGSPAALKNAELAYNEADNVLYYGYGDDGSGNATSIIGIAGSGNNVTISGTQTITGNKTFTGSLNFSSAIIDTISTTGSVTVGGNLTVNGTTTTINSTNVSIDDLVFELGATASPSDAGADGGGFLLKGTTDKSFLWSNALDAWSSNQNINLADTYSYMIDGNVVLSETSLGSGVTGSSLTSVGTIGTGTWQGTAIGTSYGGTGIAGGFQSGELLIGTSSGGLAKATLTAGTGISISNTSGGITINAQETLSAGDGIDFTAGVVSVDLKANGGLIIESTELAVDLSASSITGTLALADGGTGATSASGARTSLGLGTIATQDANNVNITGGTIDNITIDGGVF